MEILPDCLPCMLKQALTAARKASSDEKVNAEITRSAARLLGNSESFSCAPELCRMIHEEVKRATACKDPYFEDKCKEIQLAKDHYNELSEFVDASANPLEAALKVAAVGNIIDAAVDGKLNPENLHAELNKPFERFKIEEFTAQLKNAHTILYIGDNSGEAVFDTILLKHLTPRKIIYAVRGAAVLNDVDMDMAKHVGIERFAEVMSSGCSSPGCIFEECSDEFKKIFNAADIVIAKGQGNYEGLSECERKIFFLLKAKCPVLATHLHVPQQSYVLTD